MLAAAGNLDQRVILQTQTIGRDAVGGPTETWANTATVWGSVRPLSGKRIAQAQQTGSAVTKEVEIRWRSGITSAMRVKFSDNRVAKIAWFEEYKRDGRIILVCEDVDG